MNKTVKDDIIRKRLKYKEDERLRRDLGIASIAATGGALIAGGKFAKKSQEKTEKALEELENVRKAAISQKRMKPGSQIILTSKDVRDGAKYLLNRNAIRAGAGAGLGTLGVLGTIDTVRYLKGRKKKGDRKITGKQYLKNLGKSALISGGVGLGTGLVTRAIQGRRMKKFYDNYEDRIGGQPLYGVEQVGENAKALNGLNFMDIPTAVSTTMAVGGLGIGARRAYLTRKELKNRMKEKNKDKIK